MSTYFSKNLKYLRGVNNISQQQLADKLNIDRSTISRYENNDIEPTVENVIAIANVLGVSVADFVGRDIDGDDLYFDELDDLWFQYKHLLTDEDKSIIKFIIEKRVKENDRQNN